ncbi:MAG: hypothetical protein PHN88_14875 [Ignavibacteria bacterium]|nr:hypothetical protein [Ignavibacteria bacterium]
MAATDDEIRDALADRLLSGVDEKQIGDHRVKYTDVEKAYKISKEIAADNIDDYGPFLPMRFGE